MTALAEKLMPKNWSSQLRFFIIIAVSVIFFDQVSKYQAVAHLTRAFEIPTGTAELGFVEKVDIFLTLRHPVRAEAVSVVDNFWHFRYVENPGAAWGFLSGAASWFRTPFFLIVSLAAMAFIIVYYRRTTPEQRYLRLALALVLGGAIGNFLDRVRLSYVIDFIDWHWYDKATWPTFNVADSAITVGVTIMVLDMLLAGKAAPKEKTTAKAKGST